MSDPRYPLPRPYCALLRGTSSSHRRIVLAALFAAWCLPIPSWAEVDSRATPQMPSTKPAAEADVTDLVNALARAGRKRDALAEADRFIQIGKPTATLRAQRGFLRRELADPRGAAEDFAAALAGDGLTADQRSNVQAGLAEAQAAEIQGGLDRAQGNLLRGAFTQAADEADLILKANPASQAAMRIRFEALIGAGRKSEALADADRFLLITRTNASLRAQRGFLRRELNDAPGAAEDFASALTEDGLAPDQRRNVLSALMEAQTAARPQRNRQPKPRAAVKKPPPDPNSDAAVRLRIDALSRAGRKDELKIEIDRLIARGSANGWVYAQRGFARRETGDFRGAAQDFEAALARGDLDPRAIPNIRYARAEAAAMQAERDGNPLMAEASYREFVQAEPAQADGWFKLGYLLLQQKRRPEGAEALAKGLEIRPVGAAYLDAANANIFTNSPLASRLYREGLDHWYAGDPSFAGRSEADRERVRNEVVQADASIRTTMSVGGIGGRPEAAGGSNNSAGAETRVRFDGRYLPAVRGLEAVAHGFTGKDSNGVRETDAGIGLRYRPIPDLNLYVGGLFDHFFEPNSENQFVLNWGLGLGSDPYPYMAGWNPYWDFGTFGAWRTGDGRVLEDTRGNAGFLYEFRTPVRGAIGPTILAVAGYDSKAADPWAAGIGPSVLSYFWLGGDPYRSYDAILTMQVGYIFSVGESERQRGWRGQVGLTF